MCKLALRSMMHDTLDPLSAFHTLMRSIHFHSLRAFTAWKKESRQAVILLEESNTPTGPRRIDHTGSRKHSQEVCMVMLYAQISAREWPSRSSPSPPVYTSHARITMLPTVSHKFMAIMAIMIVAPSRRYTRAADLFILRARQGL